MIARVQIRLTASVGLAITLLAGCNARLPGQPNEAERWRTPAEITDFNQLYTQNCAGCHGVGGKLGAARSLNDPLYLAFVTDDTMRQAIAKGTAGTICPRFLNRPAAISRTSKSNCSLRVCVHTGPSLTTSKVSSFLAIASTKQRQRVVHPPH